MSRADWILMTAAVLVGLLAGVTLETWRESQWIW
jgi:hypothetical protein